MRAVWIAPFLSFQLALTSVLPIQLPIFLKKEQASTPDQELVCIEHDFQTTHGKNKLRATLNDPSGLKIDPKSQQWSGYLDTQDNKQLFFWLFESRNNPATDPIIIWLNGGPGCSSLYGALTQWGPKVLRDNGKLEDNPAFLNENFTVLFLEQPIGVGFSFGTNGVFNPDTSAAATADIMRFLDVFLTTDFKGRSFGIQALHLGGESYAGHYIPSLAQAIVNRPPATRPYINLQSVFIGNGWYDALIQQRTVYQMICDANLSPNKNWLMTPDECQAWDRQLIVCEEQMRKCLRDRSECNYVGTACIPVSGKRYEQMKARDAYDLARKKRLEEPRNDVEEGRNLLQSYLYNARPDLGVKNIRNWQLCLDQMLLNFRSSGDETRSVLPELSVLLASQNYPTLRVLLFAVSQLIGAL